MQYGGSSDILQAFFCRNSPQELSELSTEVVGTFRRKPAEILQSRKIPFLYIKKGCGVIHALPCPALRQVKQAGQGGGWITPLNKKLFSAPETIEATKTPKLKALKTKGLLRYTIFCIF
jgi:hypothetical protein